MFNDLAQDLKNVIRIRGDKIYGQELPTIKYKFTSSGKMAIESKKEYKERTGKKSPDYSDSLAIANFGRKIKTMNDTLNRLINK